eukprot:gene19484-25370_t
MNYSLLSVLLICLITLSYGFNELNVTANNASTSTIYVFAHSWTPEYCYGKTSSPGCSSPESYWGKYYTIHGLWPQYTTSGYPSYCTTESFDSSVVDTIGWTTMTTYWPNVDYALTSSDYTEFWEHEWTKHGTCSGLSQATYFQNTINLYLKYGTPSILTSAVGSTISASSLRTAMGGSSYVALQCTSGSYLSGAYSCWSQTNGIPGSQTACPSGVIAEDTCTSSTLKVTSF